MPGSLALGAHGVCLQSARVPDGDATSGSSRDEVALRRRFTWPVVGLALRARLAAVSEASGAS